jgi:hypothetical protein
VTHVLGRSEDRPNDLPDDLPGSSFSLDAASAPVHASRAISVSDTAMLSRKVSTRTHAARVAASEPDEQIVTHDRRECPCVVEREA